MSHIPNSAMPHAGDTAEANRDDSSGTTLRDRAGKLADTARANPKMAAAAGAAVVAGIAAAIPLMRGRSSSSGKSKSSTSKKS